MMSKTTITINGEECVILPAPKGAFVIARPFNLLYFVQAIAIEINKFKDYASDNFVIGAKVHSLYYDKGERMMLNDKKCLLNIEATKNILDDLLNPCLIDIYGRRGAIVYLYQAFTSNNTPLSCSAISWFRDKFKEYNITKDDFDVFA